MEQRFCTACGAALASRFCTSCGTPASELPPLAVPAAPAPAALTWAPVEAPVPAPAPERRRTGRIVAGVTGVLALAVGAGVGYVVLTDDDKPTAAPGYVEPVDSVLGEPGEEWSVRAEDLVDKAGATFASPSFRGEGESVNPIALPDVVVTMISHYDDMTERSSTWLVGLDPESGQRLWTQVIPDGRWPTCQALSSGAQLACINNEWDDDGNFRRSTLEIRKTRTGNVASSFTFDHQLDGVTSSGERVWTVGVESDWTIGAHYVHVTSGNSEDIDADWSKETKLLEGDEYGGEDWTTLKTDGTSVWTNVAGQNYRIDPRTGELIEDTDVEVVPGPDGDPLVLRSGDEESWFDGSDVRFGGHVWDAWGGRPVVRDGLYGAGSAVFDFATGAEVRRLPNDESDASWVNDRVLRVSTWVDDETTVEFQEARTGEVLWTDREGRWSWASTSDAFVSFGNDSDTFDVRSAWTGDVAWSRRLPVTTYEDGENWTQTTGIATTSDALVVVSTQTMWGFTDFAEPDAELLAEPARGGSDTDESTDDSDSGTGLALGDEYITKCGSEPEFVPVSSEGDTSGVRVTFEVTATCSGGQWLDSAEFRIDLTGTSPDSEEPIGLATGVFDFSDQRVWVPETDDGQAGSTVTTNFPVKQVWATPEEIDDFIERQVIVVDCVDEDASSSTSDSGSDSEDELAPADPGTPDSGDASSSDEVTDPDTREENSLAALRRLAAQDKTHVLENLAGKWMPQLSSKQDGTHDRIDAKTYDYTAIYEEHLRLRLEYPEVRLLWSGDWGSFEHGDYWVSVVGRASSRPKPALDWCRSTQRAPSQCYAKLVRVPGPFEETTRLQH